jgi:hypothetical protein
MAARSRNGLVLLEGEMAPVAVPTRGGRIVASRDRLTAPRGGAGDPFQGCVAGDVEHATERWADEHAAAGVGDRAATSASSPSWSTAALSSGGSRVVSRVRALLVPAPPQRPALLLLAGGLMCCAMTAALHAQADGQSWFGHSGIASEMAEAPHWTSSRRDGGPSRPARLVGIELFSSCEVVIRTGPDRSGPGACRW